MDAIHLRRHASRDGYDAAALSGVGHEPSISSLTVVVCRSEWAAMPMTLFVVRGDLFFVACSISSLYASRSPF
ncbi:hypothetical protein RGU70_03635 [Herbaspirillum sp. RTI4]|uniref:hypothetical protein n=1 Tax=Herbaspirillum sp. RTI4 TaxID=3048640 RepID=UPI002AB55A84|nr:hypothetical protein [Herbaspirillum sp. RTI4]MDY7577409.1 hypothetical protein [Herbaspirillum sp. RTI4]MEA9981685.1 hypothetical protein [Herbaspirillum sp. RTI4]